MPALFFPNLNALRLTLVSGIVPRELTGSPAVAGRDAQGRVWLEPVHPLTRDALAALARFGVQVVGAAAPGAARISCWAELLPPVPSPEPLPRTLLLVVPDRSLARVAARLGRARECQFSARLADHSASTFA
ncbi:MAG TPA: hypothetical protein VM529_07200, partial [Gemmata sp.]|nr:hypothetical protein [Gemmata sp.]